MLNNDEKGVIRTEWRDGKYKNRERLEELEQLQACDVDTVCEVVGADPAQYVKKPVRKKVSYEQAVKDDVVRAVLLEGMEYKEADEKFGVPLGNISHWVKKAKERQQYFESEADRLAKAPAEAEPAREEGQGKSRAEKELDELREGVAGLGAFCLSFALVEKPDKADDWVLDKMLTWAEGYVRGYTAALRAGVAP